MVEKASRFWHFTSAYFKFSIEAKQDLRAYSTTMMLLLCSWQGTPPLKQRQSATANFEAGARRNNVPDVNQIDFTELATSEDATDPTLSTKTVKHGRFFDVESACIDYRQHHFHTRLERSSTGDVGE